jgi:predicted  nucleic acid-binding Zn-ribbon protein
LAHQYDEEHTMSQPAGANQTKRKGLAMVLWGEKAMEELLEKLVQLHEHDLIIREQQILWGKSRSGQESDDYRHIGERIEELRKELPTEVVAKYDRLIKGKKVPVVKVLSGQCQGCFYKLPTGLAMEVKANAGINECPNCGRFLYS